MADPGFDKGVQFAAEWLRRGMDQPTLAAELLRYAFGSKESADGRPT